MFRPNEWVFSRLDGRFLPVPQVGGGSAPAAGPNKNDKMIK